MIHYTEKRVLITITFNDMQISLRLTVKPKQSKMLSACATVL